MTSKMRVSQIAQCILTYNLDNNSVSIPSTLKDLGFTKQLFFDRLYIQREKKEQEIKESLLHEQGIFLLVGFPGTGKTTLVSKVLADLQSAENVLVIHIDFKSEHALSDKAIQGVEHMQEKINQMILKKCWFILEHLGFTDYDLLEYVLTKRSENELIGNTRFLQVKQKIKFQWQAVKDRVSLTDWLKDMVAQENAKIGELIEELHGHLSYENYLEFFKEGKPSYKFTTVFFDNIDSVPDGFKRSLFFRCLRYEENKVVDFAKIVTTIRSENEGKFIRLEDRNSFVMNRININYDDFIEGTISDDADIGEERQKRKLAEELFSQAIVKSRLDYIEEFIDKRDRNTLQEYEIYSQFKEFSRIIIAGKRIRLALSSLANYDRRVKLVLINNFLEYLIFELKLTFESLGPNMVQHKFIIESFFYQWLIGKNKIFDTDIYNTVKKVQEWVDSGKTEIGCDLDHLLITLISNLTYCTSKDYSFDKRTAVGNILEQLELIGFNSSQVKNRIFEIYKKLDHVPHGIIELSRFYSIERPNDIKDNIEILITPRSIHLCEYSIHKFIYNICCLRKEKYMINGERFSFDDRNPVTKKTLFANLYYLVHLAEMHWQGLKNMKEMLFEKFGKKWYDVYRHLFCIQTDINYPENDKSGNLHFFNTITSHIKFLDTSKRERHHQVITDDIIREYNRLYKSFYNEVVNLKIIDSPDNHPEWSFRVTEALFH